MRAFYFVNFNSKNSNTFAFLASLNRKQYFSLKIILNKENLQLTLSRLALQLLEDPTPLEDIVYIGMQPRGVFVAQRLIAEMQSQKPGENINSGILDITFYRDDVRGEIHEAKKTELNYDVTGKKVVLIDDVLYTGRTVRAALDALQDFGRPRQVELAVLVNRQFSRELPIQPDYCGLAINTHTGEKIKVDWEKQNVILY